MAQRRPGAGRLTNSISTDTIVALSSGRPPAAVAVIRTSGPHALAAAEAVIGQLPEARQAALRTLRDPRSGEVLDRALVLRFDAPASATGEYIVEYQCHGGRAVADAIVSTLATQPGLRLAEPGEFTRRAFHNGRIDLTEAEGLADLLEAETEGQRRAALQMAGGGVRRLVEAWRNRIVLLSAQAEAAIDYVDEEDETATDTGRLADEAVAIAAELRQWLDRPRIEPLKAGIRIVVAGPPNAGKSSLINALSESDRAIVTDIPGTTRDVIEVPVAIDGIPFVLVDTAGLRDGEDMVERMGIDRAQSEIQRADILLWLGDPDVAPEHPQLIRIHAKFDIHGPESQIPESLAVSSVTRAGLSDLITELGARANRLMPSEDGIALNERQAIEISRAFAALQQRNSDIVVLAELLRVARDALDRITGRSGIEDTLDALFGRFCLGK